MKRIAGLLTLLSTIGLHSHSQFHLQSAEVRDNTRKLTEDDYRQMLAQLNITKPLLKEANGKDPKEPNAANYEESKANPYSKLPGALILKNESEDPFLNYPERYFRK